MKKSSIAKSIFSFIKSEAVLTASWILAIASMFFVPPDEKYLNYIDWRSLSILWSLMVIMNVFKQNGFFNLLAEKLISSINGKNGAEAKRQDKKTFLLISSLVFLCFFLSMAITNDVALITFVPFAIMILEGSSLLIPTIVLQTVAANLGSMLTPVGNPQNLYLFALGNFSVPDFITLILPYWISSFILLIAAIFLITKIQRGPVGIQSRSGSEIKPHGIPIFKTLVFSVLFVIALLTVSRLIPFYILAALTLVCSLILQRKAFFKADYFLLLTFIGFFIFTGNMARIPTINVLLKKLVEGHEMILGTLASQVISNVPAALLLSGFTENIRALVLGVDIGGLGTLIASMASLISFKFYAKTEGSRPGRYLLYFTAVNIIFLAVLIAQYFLMPLAN